MFLAELQNGTGLTDISCVRMIWAKFLGPMFENKDIWGKLHHMYDNCCTELFHLRVSIFALGALQYTLSAFFLFLRLFVCLLHDPEGKEFLTQPFTA